MVPFPINATVGSKTEHEVGGTLVKTNKDVAGPSGKPAPSLSSRPWFFSLLPAADIMRTEVSLISIQRRFTGFIRFITERPLFAKDVATAVEAGQKLLTAAEKGTVEEVKEHISYFADINRVDEGSMSAIMYAAQRGDLDMIKALVAAGSRINMANTEGKDALMLAAEKGHADIVAYLIAWGADFKRADRTGCTAFVLAARAGETAVIQSFIDAGVDIDAPVDNGSTPIMFAAESGHVGFVMALIAKGADVNKINIKNKMTAVMFAAKKGQIELVALLLQYATSVDEGGMSATMYAAQRGDLDMIKALVAAGSRINMANKEGKDALMLAAEKGHVDIVAYLITHGADFKRADRTGCTAFVLAARAGKTAVIQSFIDAGVDIDAPVDNGSTPIMFAAESGHVEFVMALIAKGADVNKINIRNKMTAVMFAAKKGRTEVVELLLKHGASADEEAGSRNALIFAAESDHYATVTSLIEGGANQFKALLTVLKYNHPQITKVIVRAWLSSKKNKFDALTAINCCTHDALTNAPAGSKVNLLALDALAEGGLTLTKDELATLNTAFHFSSEAEQYIKKRFVDGHISREGRIGNAYWSGNHALVDELIDAPLITKSNPLGLKPSAHINAFNPDHLTSGGGDYLHAIGRLHDQSPKPDWSCDMDPMADAGWRSMVTAPLRNARNEATEASQQISKLLADPERGFALIDRIGQPVPANDIRLKDTLFAFELERNEPLNQIVEPPASPAATESMTPAQIKHQKAREAQAAAILASNKIYSRLKLNMPALTQAKEVEKTVRSGLRSGAEAAVELDKLLAETEQTFFEAPGIESELAYHWFISEVKAVCETLKETADGFRTLNPRS